MRFWRKKQKWQVIAALLFAVWILMEAESFTGETAVETEEETTEKTVTAGIGYRAASADSEGITEQLVSDMSFEQVQTLMDEMLGEDSFSIGTALKNMINGETVFSKEAVQQFLRSLFFERLEKERANFFRILLANRSSIRYNINRSRGHGLRQSADEKETYPMSYVDSVLSELIRKNPAQDEFIQAATEERTVTISSYVMGSSGRKTEPSPAKNPLAAMAFTPSAYQASAATSEK